MKKCTKCGIEKELGEFYGDSGKGGRFGKRGPCKECIAQIIKNRKDQRLNEGLCITCGKNKIERGKRCEDCWEKQSFRVKKYKEKLRAKNICTKCCKNKTNGRSRCKSCSLTQSKQARMKYRKRADSEWCSRCYKNKKLSKRYCGDCLRIMRDYNKKNRRGVMEYYGGKCECCGENRYEFLTFEHKNGDGSIHRKEIGKSAAAGFARWLKKNNYPDFIGILCWNCNLAKSNFKYCPHQSIFQV